MEVPATAVLFKSEAELDEDELLGALVALVDVAEFGLPPSDALEVPVELPVPFALVLVEEGRVPSACSRVRPAALATSYPTALEQYCSSQR